MRIVIGIAAALSCAVAAIFYAAWTAQQMPPSPLAGIEHPVAPAPLPKAAEKEVSPEPVPPPRTQETAKVPAPEPDSGPSLEEVQRDVRNVTPNHVLPGPDIEGRLIERLPAVVPPAPPPRPPKPERWRRALVVAPGVLKSGDEWITIAGINPLATDAICSAEDGTEWPCGKFAASAMRRLIRQRAVECDPVEMQAAEIDHGDSGNTLEQRLSAALDQKPASERGLVTRCRVAGRDIGEWLVGQGWATPQPDSGYDAALEQAREAGRGQWRKTITAELPATPLPEPAAIETGVTSLLTPGMSATDALVPLTDAGGSAFEPEAPQTDETPVTPAERGGLDQ